MITAWITRNPCYLRAIQGHSGGIAIRPEMMEYTFIPHNWKEYIFHGGSSWNSQSNLVSGLIPGGKENDKARQAVFFTLLDPFGNNPDEEKPHDDYTVPQEVHYQTELETHSRCSVLDKIIQSARSRIAILANQIICNHHL